MLVLREIAREAGRDRELAACLWRSGWHEARILASLVAEPQTFTGEEMEEWVREIDSWDLCDQCCSNLFSRTTLAWEKAMSWSGRDKEFVRRAGFALMAVLAVHDRSSPDERFCAFLPLIRTYSTDNRQMVKKAVNWALRQIGKRSMGLRDAAIREAEAIREAGSPSQRWIASDALRELNDPAVTARIRSREERRLGRARPRLKR